MSVEKDWLHWSLAPGPAMSIILISLAARCGHKAARGSQIIYRCMFAADTTHNISPKSRIVNSIRHFYYFYSAIGLQ